MNLTNREAYENDMNELQKLRKENDFLSAAIKQLKEDYTTLEDKLIDERKRYEFKINDLEIRLEWLKEMNTGLIKLSMEVIRLYDGDENEDN